MGIKKSDGVKKKLLLFGGGGHCRSVIDCIQAVGGYDDLGIVDFDTSQSVVGIPVVGNDDALPELINAGWNEGFVTVGSIGSTSTRRKIYQRIKEAGLRIPTIISPTAILARNIVLDEGVFVGKRVVLNSGSKVGCCAILNTGAIVEHDCNIGAFSHISPGTTLCGEVSIGEDSHIGAGSVIRQGIKVGGKALIGLGSVVVKDIPDGVKAYGNPCKVVK